MSADYEGWAILELMGHRRLAGYVTEVDVAGAGMLRIDVPTHRWLNGCTCGSPEPQSADHGLHRSYCYMFRSPDEERPEDRAATQFYAPSALYCLTPTTEELARGLAQSLKPTPVHRFELPVPPAPVVPEPYVPGDCECGHAFEDHGPIDVRGESPCATEGCGCVAYEVGLPF